MLTTPPRSDAAPVELRRLAALVSALFLLESSLFSAVTPLLPHYAHDFRLSQTGVGVLSGAYSIGMLAGTPLARRSVASAGIRPTVLRGLVILAFATFAFVFGRDIVLLDAARVIQGFGSGCILTASFTWLIDSTGDDRRERVLGEAVGAAVFGTLLGPAIGTLALAIGVGPVFGVVLAFTAILVGWVWRMPAPPATRPPVPIRSIRPRKPLAYAAWFVALPGMTYGALNAVMPLHLTRLGASGEGVGATFLCAAGLATALAPATGRLAAHRGARASFRTALVVTAALLLALAVVSGLAPSVVLTAVTIASITTLWVPSLALLSRIVEGAGLDNALSAVMINVSIAAGEGVGSLLGSTVAQSISDQVTFVSLAILALLTGALLRDPRALDPD